MGFSAQPFAVDLDKVRQIFGSNDLSLLEKVKSSKLYEHYSSQSDDYDFDEALKDIVIRYIKPEDRKETKSFFGFIKNKPSSGLNPEFAHTYGYALLVICDILGTSLSDAGDIFYAGGEAWTKVNEIFKTKGITIDLDRIWGDEKLFDLPYNLDFPGITHYSKEEISYLLNELAKIEIQDLRASYYNEEFEEIEELITTFKEGLQICKDKNVEFVSFLH
jgi:hypothetical protein